MNRKILIIGLIVLFIGASLHPATSSIVHIQKEDNNEQTSLTYTYQFQEPTLTQQTINENTFTKIEMPGTFTIGNKSGTPTYQVSPVKLLIPYGKHVANIRVTVDQTKQLNLLKDPLFPYQPQVPINDLIPNQFLNKGQPVEFVVDKESYKSMNKVPAEIFQSLGVGYCRGYQILTLNLYPTEYIPGIGQLSYHSKMTVTVELKSDGNVNRFYRADPDDRAWVEKLVDNPEISETYPSQSTNHYPGGLCNPSDNSGLGYDYVIITRKKLADFPTNNSIKYTWNDLIQRKQADGLTATKVIAEDILACSDYWNTSDPLFNDTPALIREFCKDAYLDWGTQYILIAGDNDAPLSPDDITGIERRIFGYGKLPEGAIEPVDSDIYWTHLDGTFNSDHDRFWGEWNRTDDFDLYSELYSGSIPCHTPGNISNWLSKSFYYEDSTESKYLENAAFFAGNSYASTTGDDYIDYSAIKGSDQWFGPDPNASKYPELLGFQYGFETWNQEHPDIPFNVSVKWTAEEEPNPGWKGGDDTVAIQGMREAINHDECTLISAVAHANPCMSMDVWKQDWETEYHNTKPFFLYDYGCHVGDLDAVYEGVVNSMLFHSDTALAFAMIAHTSKGWGSSGNDTNGSSSVIQKCFWDYFFDVRNNSKDIENWQLGKGLEWARDELAPTLFWGDAADTWRAVIESTLLFGDPALKIKPSLKGELEITDITGGYGGFRKGGIVRAAIKNVGERDATDIQWTMSVQGGLLRRIHITTTGKIDELKIDDEKIVGTDTPIAGFGNIKITVTAHVANGDTITKTVDGFVLLIYVIIIGELP